MLNGGGDGDDCWDDGGEAETRSTYRSAFCRSVSMDTRMALSGLRTVTVVRVLSVSGLSDRKHCRKRTTNTVDLGDPIEEIHATKAGIPFWRKM